MAKKLKRKHYRRLIITAIVIAVLIGFGFHKNLNRFSFIVVIPSAEGTITDELTGRPMENVYVITKNSLSTFNLLDSDVIRVHGKAGHTDKNGYFYIESDVVPKLPLIQSFAYHKITANPAFPGVKDKYFYYGGGGAISDNLKPLKRDFSLSPHIINPDLCENPGGDFRPIEEAIDDCRNNFTTMIFENKPEVCEREKCAAYDEKWCQETVRDGCRRGISALYQDVDINDVCQEMSADTVPRPRPDDNCIIAKAVKYKDPKLCYDQFIFDEEDNRGYAPPLFREYFRYGTFSSVVNDEMSYRDACLTMMAYRLGDTEICEQIEYEEENEFCNYFAIQKTMKNLDEWYEYVDNL